MSEAPLYSDKRWCVCAGAGPRWRGGALKFCWVQGCWLLLLPSSLLLSSLEWIETIVYEPQKCALLGTASQFCEVVAGAFAGMLRWRNGFLLTYGGVSVRCVQLPRGGSLGHEPDEHADEGAGRPVIRGQGGQALL